MFLSRIPLTPKARVMWGNPYAVHKMAGKAFPTTNAEQNRVLWRMEPYGRYLLVQSERQPDWGFLDGSPAVAARIEVVGNSRLQFRAGTQYEFLLVGNPTWNYNAHKRPRYKSRDQLQWLNERGDLYGFQVLNAVIQDAQTITIERRRKQRFPLLAVTFRGLLEVTDPDGFERAVKKGIGPGKAFGLGLLSVRPA